MSILSRLLGAASAYMRRRMADAGRSTRSRSGPPGGRPSLPGAPPIQRDGGRRRPPTGNAPTGAEDDGFDEFEQFGRGYNYDQEDMELLTSKMRLVSSSNVYGYAFQQETPTMGILYVTYLDWIPAAYGGSGERSGSGPTYAYYDVPLAKYRAFEATAASSAGGAVWDYLRVRHSAVDHQHTYALISVSGEYVPRRTTVKGFRERQVPAIGTGMRGGLPGRKTLPAEDRAFSRQTAQRNYAASPNRGAPNRGRPNRGK